MDTDKTIELDEAEEMQSPQPKRPLLQQPQLWSGPYLDIETDDFATWH